MFAIVDIETCGGRFIYPKGRIIEIAIILHDGLTVVDKFSTLINPECFISPLYTNISGITNDMVRDAPKFYEVAQKILEMTEGRVFVAHNSSFDYNFIKDEFASLGAKFKRETLCTVKLSRKLMPGRLSYSLGNLCAGLNIHIENRHRAEGDAMATAQLLDLLLQLKSQDPRYKNMGAAEIMTRRIDKIKQYILNKIPEECGVYYFLDKEGGIIYIGKSVNMYNRAISHFNSDEKKGKQMLNELYNVDFVTTGSELIALLLESEEIKKHKPKYNRVRKSDVFTHCIDWFKDKNGIINFKIAEPEEAEHPLLSFTTYLTARERLESWIDEHELCLRYCGLTGEESICFNHQIKKCNGICAGEEELELYNERAEKLLKKHVFEHSNFVLLDKGRNAEERSVVLVEDGRYSGYGYFDAADPVHSPRDLKDMVKRMSGHPDSNDLIKSWMKQKGNMHKRVFPF
jgi:DNA polymerase III subunit epsilon